MSKSNQIGRGQALLFGIFLALSSAALVGAITSGNESDKSGFGVYGFVLMGAALATLIADTGKAATNTDEAKEASHERTE